MKKIIYFLIVVVLFSSCNEFLDVKPTGSLIPTTVEDYDNLLANPDIKWNCWLNLVYMDPDVNLSDAYYNSLWENQWKGQYIWDENPYTLEDNDFDWDLRYENIYVYNLIIANIDNAPLGSKSIKDRKRVKGEAYAQRAFDYFLLVNEYAPHYSDANKSAPAIPLSLEQDLTAQLPKSTVAEVYEQIFRDLTIAEELLNNADVPSIYENENFRPGKASILGLKALASLYMGNFDDAKAYSNQALNLYNFVYDLNNINFIDTEYLNPWEGIDILDLETSTDTRSILWNRAGIFYEADPIFFYPSDLVNLYDKTNDRRWYLFSSSEDNYGSDISPNWAFAAYFIELQAGITVPQLYLINAEAKARTSDGQGALDILEEFLVNRITDYTSPVYTTDEAVLQIVKNERRKEFIGTGHNLIDLKRYHAYGETIPTFTRVVNGETFTLEPGSKKYVVPISKKIKSFNPNLR